MEVSARAVGLTFADEGEAAAFARQLREALHLAYGVRRRLAQLAAHAERPLAMISDARGSRQR